MDARQEASFVRKLDKAASRNDEIMLLIQYRWSYREIGQALEVSKGLVSGVMDRWKRKQQKECQI